MEVSGFHNLYSRQAMLQCHQGVNLCDSSDSGFHSTSPIQLPSFVKQDLLIFDGFQDLDDWIHAFDLFYERYQISDGNKVFLASSYLQGAAKIWFDKDKKLYQQCSWLDFKLVLREKFPSLSCGLSASKVDDPQLNEKTIVKQSMHSMDAVLNRIESPTTHLIGRIDSTHSEKSTKYLQEETDRLLAAPTKRIAYLQDQVLVQKLHSTCLLKKEGGRKFLNEPKMDEDGSPNQEKVIPELSSISLMPGDGDVPMIQISALNEGNVDDLLKTVMLIVEQSIEVYSKLAIDGVSAIKERESISDTHLNSEVASTLTMEDVVSKSTNQHHFFQILWDPGGWMEKYGVLAVFPDSPWPLQSFCIFNSTQNQNEDRFLNLERKVELILLHIHKLEALSSVTYSSLFKLLQILESALSLQLDYFLDDLISWNILLEVSYSNKMLAFDPALVKEYFENWWDKEQSTINCKRNRGEQRNDRDVFLQRSAKEFITMMGPRPHGLCFGMDVLSVFYLDIRKKQARLASLSFEDGVISYFDRLSLYHNAWTELFEKDHFTLNVSQSVGCSQFLQQITACSTIRASSSSRQGIETQVLEIVECCHCSNELDMLNSTNILQDIYHLAINCMVLLQIFHKLREYKNQEGFLDFMDVHRKALVILGKFVMCGMLISSNIVLVNDFIDPSRVLSARRLVKGLNKDDMVYDNILVYMNQFCNYLSGKLDLISELKSNLMCQELVVSLMEEEEYRLKEFSNEVIKVFDNKLSTVRDLIFLCNRTCNFGEGQCITSNTGRLKIRGLYYFNAKKFAHNVVMGDQNKGHGYIVWDPGGMKFLFY